MKRKIYPQNPNYFFSVSAKTSKDRVFRSSLKYGEKNPISLETAIWWSVYKDCVKMSDGKMEDESTLEHYGGHHKEEGTEGHQIFQ